jgi:hypothetical protein
MVSGQWFSMVNPVSSTSETDTAENIIQITQVKHFGTMLH